MQDEQPAAVTLNEKDVELECFKRGYDCFLNEDQKCYLLMSTDVQ